MCIAIIADKTFPSEVTLRLFEARNSDGIGVAYRDNGIVNWSKGIDLTDLLDIGANTNGPWLIHMRLATVGSPSKALAHPFPLSGSLEINGSGEDVLIHNGHWKDWQQNLLLKGNKIPRGEYSDTRAIAVMTGWYGSGFLDVYGDDLGSVALMTSDTISRYGRWYWDKRDSIHISNTHGLYESITVKSARKGEKDQKIYEDIRDWSDKRIANYLAREKKFAFTYEEMGWDYGIR